MNLTTIKPPVRDVEINGKKSFLEYTLKSFAYLEELYGSVENAINSFNTKN